MNTNKTIASMQGVAIDSINNAGQGHAGMAIGAAPITYSLIGENMNISKEDPKWINRDRFVLSAGHGSMSFYSIMHFLGLLGMEDMKKHKVLGSKTPSHPETEMFDYVDASTGPLGQGIAMAVGMAISLKKLKKKYNKSDLKYFDHSIFSLHGDGCIQEGVALEAMQLAGTLQLEDLILIHDFNEIQIDSTSKEVNNLDFKKYMEAQGFDVFIVTDPSVKNINKAIQEARKTNKPSYISVKTAIAKNTENEGKSQGHNFALSEDKTLKFKKAIGLTNTKPFEYDKDVYDFCDKLWETKDKNYAVWKNLEKEYKAKYKDEWQEIQDIYNENYSVNLKPSLSEKDVATRNYITPIMKELEKYPHIMGGSADLAAATKVVFDDSFLNGGKEIRYGIREFSMTSINNGIYLHSKIRTIDSTFLAFSDYSKPAIRLGGIMEIPSIHVFTHDTYQVGGDGPTHQPVSQLPMLRSTQRTIVIRPCDESEAVAGFNYAFKNKDKQIAIIFCRQPIKSFNMINGDLKPAYVVSKEESYDVSLVASGSEVELAVEVANEISSKGIKAQVISVPLLQELVDNEKLIKQLGLDKKPIFAIEASSEMMWYKLAKYNKFDAQLAKGFGYSAPGDIVYEKKGFSVDNISKKVSTLLKAG